MIGQADGPINSAHWLGLKQGKSNDFPLRNCHKRRIEREAMDFG
jgi:hypothetical protein